MKKKLISSVLACAFCLAALPVGAMAAEADTAPVLTGATIADKVATTDANGNLYLSVPSSLNLAGQTFNLTASEKISFVRTAENAADRGELYASSGGSSAASLRFAIDLTDLVPGGSDVNFNTPDYSIDLTSEDGITWTGTFNENFNATVNTLGQAMNLTQATLRADMMVNSADEGNEAWGIHANSDAANTQLVIYRPGTTLYTVTYHYGDKEYTWQLPEGADLADARLPIGVNGDNYEGWYTDEACNDKVDFTQNPTVEDNLQLYAKEKNVEPSQSFLDDLEDGVATLETKEDWDEFVANAAAVKAGQRVELSKDIDLEGAAYQAIQFAGDFNGNNHKLSNATFTPNGENCGVFAKIGVDQRIANLTLENITANGNALTTTYAGILAGQVYGGDGHRSTTLIQNVHVIGGSATGRTAAGVVGFTFLCTVQYCSAEGTNVTGMANAAGITGLTYATIDSCYSTDVSLFGLQARGRGGIAGKLLESGEILNCWYDYNGTEGPVGEIDQGMVENEYLYDSSKSSLQLRGELQRWISGQSVWEIVTENAKPQLKFIQSAVDYDEFINAD